MDLLYRQRELDPQTGEVHSDLEVRCADVDYLCGGALPTDEAVLILSQHWPHEGQTQAIFLTTGALREILANFDARRYPPASAPPTASDTPEAVRGQHPPAILAVPPAPSAHPS